MNNRSLAVVTLAAFALLAGQAASVAHAQSEKIAVKTADDLPRHTYQIEGKASDFLVSDKPFRELLAKVAADAKDDLAKYDIKDPTTLQSYHRILQAAAMFAGDYDGALAHADQVKALEAKESKRMMSGLVLRALIAAERSGKSGDARTAVFSEELRSHVAGLPWEKIADDVKMSRAQAQFATRELILGQVQSGLDPIVAEQKGAISEEIARGIVTTRFTMDYLLPQMTAIAGVYGGLIEANAVEKKNIWPERDIALDAATGTPVVLCVWDSGTDVSLFKDQLWVNKGEQVNGKDDDANGFVDDVNGIAWDLEIKPTPALLHPLDAMKNPLDVVQGYTKGLGDSQSGVSSAEADSLQKLMRSLKPDQVKEFMEDINLYANYSHGTHVAGIALAGNPHARLLPIRITFDYRTIPLHAPSIESAKDEAAAAQACVDYMKKAGVRVVNMSWGGSRQDVEAGLEAKGVGKNAEERAELSRKIFAIQRDGLEAAMKSAPGILFVAAAGNSDNNIEFSEMMPSGIKLPNLITVGAVDQSGKPTGFTSFGAGVGLYASGFEVESYVPGGKRMRYNGTSMASPQVANLAAKLVALNPKLSVAELIEAIRAGGDPLNGDAQRLVINPKKSVGLVKGK